MKQPLIIVAGPTAVGKTALSVRLARELGGEILSADSMQVYRHMDIGSAKIKPDEMEGVPHHLIDILEPWESFDVVRFQGEAKKALAGIYQRGAIPILAGGTGFYIQSVLKDVDFTAAEEDAGYRSELEAYARQNGAEALHQLLRKADPAAAAQIHPNNVKRTIRALEYYRQTGQPISAHNEQERQKKPCYRCAYFVLNDRRDRLYEAIGRRVDRMMEEGLLGEVRRLRDMGCRRDMVSMQGLGYKELLAYLDGECSLEEAVRLIKQNTRHFAKRQLTWFRREPETIWVEKEQFGYDEERMLAYMRQTCQEKGIFPGQEEEGTQG